MTFSQAYGSIEVPRQLKTSALWRDRWLRRGLDSSQTTGDGGTGPHLTYQSGRRKKAVRQLAFIADSYIEREAIEQNTITHQILSDPQI